jgi:uncharacterized protein YqeY
MHRPLALCGPCPYSPRLQAHPKAPIPSEQLDRYNATMLTKEMLQQDLKEAMRAKDETRKSTLRMLLTAVKLAEVERLAALDEPALLVVIGKEIKDLRESLSNAEQAGRSNMVAALQGQIAVLESYLPEPLTEEELVTLAKQAIQESGASDPKEMGKAMKVLMPRVAGRAEGKTVSDIVRSLLGAG